ncbi:MAG TPA: hypothetical protein PL051_03785 [Candidatus Saccharibacteria bacterium]|nr:hypothetical protein [Candidatus Saccharibacteria bacterium]
MPKFFSKSSDSSKNTPPRRRGGETERPTSSNLSERYSFIRNRTLTGSSSAQVASTNELNAELRSPRAHVHHLTKLRRRLLVYFVGALAAAAALYMILSQLVATYAVHIAVTTPNQLTQADASTYEQAIDSYYAARPAERLRTLLNSDALLRHVQALQPEIKAISIEPSGGFGQATVEITPREPLARWSIAGSTQYVDASGVVFDRNFYSEPTLKITDNSGIPSTNNQAVTSQRFLGFVGRVIGLAKEQRLMITRITIPSQTTRQITAYVRGVRPYFKLSVDRSAGEQAEDMGRVVKWLRTTGTQARYVDIRVEGKAFYR